MSPGPAPRPAVISHRGNGFGFPENSLKAFAAAVAAGLDGVELDVHLSRDRIAVVHHDARTRGNGGRSIAHSTRSSLGADIPTLMEVLAIVPTRMWVDVEIKPWSRNLGSLVNVLDRSNVRISSFNRRTLAWVAKCLPDRPRGLLVEPHDKREEVLRWVRSLEPEGVHLPARHVQRAWVEGLRETGVRIRTYTPNRPSQWARCVDLGIDAIMTDRPCQLLAWLDRLAVAG